MAKTLGPTARVGLGFWAQQPIILGPVSVTYMPVVVTEWGTPPEAPYNIQLRTWIGTPVPKPPDLPIGEQLLDLPPKGYEYPISQRTWLQNVLRIPYPYVPVRVVEWGTPPEAPYSVQLRTWVGVKPPQVVSAPFTQDDWPVPAGSQQPRREWVWSYNLNLIGQDATTVGEQVTDLPPRPYPEPATRTWTVWYNLNLIGKDRMIVGEQVYDRPTLDQLQTVRSWTWSYNLNLIGQDQLPTGEATNIVPKAPEHHVQLRSWLWNYNLNLIGKDQLPIGQIIAERPPLAPSLLQAWISSVNLALTFLAAAPFSQSDWPINLGPIQPIRGFGAFFNLNLTGQDRLPFRQDRWPLTPAPERAISLSTWIDQTKLLLLVPFRQTDWPVPFGPRQPALSYTASYNLNLIGQDQITTGKQSYDLSPRAYPEPATRTWVWSYNLNLVAKDRMAVGGQSYDLPPKGPLQPLYGWLWNYNLNLIGQDFLPVGNRAFDLSPKGYEYSSSLRTWIGLPVPQVVGVPFNQNDWPSPYGPLLPLRSWTQSYNLNLIGQDKLPNGVQRYDLTPRAYPEPATRTWAWTYNPNLVGQDRMAAGEQVTDLPPKSPLQLLRSWTWSYNLNLIGQDILPTGEQVFELPPRWPLYYAQLRTWIGTKTSEFVAPLPFNQYDWPTTPWPRQLLRSWTWSYNLDLVGQDQLPTGKQATDLSPKGYEYANALRTWAQNLLQGTLKPLPYGVQLYDLPPKGHQQPAKTWTWSYNLNLIAQDAMLVGDQITDLPPRDYLRPIDIRTWINQTNQALIAAQGIPPPNQYDWPTPKAPLQLLRSWTWSYNLNLIGKDALPTGEQVTDLYPRGHQYPIDNRSWINRFNLALNIRTAPFNQLDWPISGEWKIQLQRPAPSWTASYNLNLIGKDRLPTGDQFFDIPPQAQPYYTSLRSFLNTLNLALITPPAPLPFNQDDWPIPAMWAMQQLGYRDRWFARGTDIKLYPPIPPEPPTPTPPTPSSAQPIPGLEWQYYDRGREPGPLGWR